MTQMTPLISFLWLIIHANDEDDDNDQLIKAGAGN